MATTNYNKKGLNLKRWEPVCSVPTSPTTASFYCLNNHIKQMALYVTSNTTAWLYNPDDDGFVALPSPALSGTFGLGATGGTGAISIGSSTGLQGLTATGGTTSTIVTNQSLAADLRGYKVHILAGPNAGVTLDIRSNTISTNATITVDTQASAFTNATVYRLITPVWYVTGASTTSSGSFKKYDYATNTWTTLSQTGLPAIIGTDGKIVSTPSFIGSDYLSFATGTATSGGASTITNTGKNWSTNQWANYQIRITGGTGAGQIRSISSNTATAITVGSAWTIQPDNTSTYSIEGNDDYLYWLGNNSVTLYRYSISGNTWTTLSPVAARAAQPQAAFSADWVYEVSESDWTNENTIINGQRIYSFRGSGGSVVDYYDIAANTWVSSLTYIPNTETFISGSYYSYYKNSIFIHKDATGRFFEFDIVTRQMKGITNLFNTQGTGQVGNRAFIYRYKDGATTIPYLYFVYNGSSLQDRMMIF